MVLDKRLLSILEKLYKYITDDEYVIVSFDEIARALPQKSADIKEDILNLERLELIKIKYSDEKNLCFASSPKGKLTIDNYQIERRRQAKRFLRELRYGILIFAIVVVGTIVGNFLSGLIGV